MPSYLRTLLSASCGRRTREACTQPMTRLIVAGGSKCRAVSMSNPR